MARSNLVRVVCDRCKHGISEAKNAKVASEVMEGAGLALAKPLPFNDLCPRCAKQIVLLVGKALTHFKGRTPKAKKPKVEAAPATYPPAPTGAKG